MAARPRHRPPAMMGGSGLTAEEEVNSARQMFNYGCFGLPWLWVINVAYFRKSQEPEIIKCESALFARRAHCAPTKTKHGFRLIVKLMRAPRPPAPPPLPPTLNTQRRRAHVRRRCGGSNLCDCNLGNHVSE